LPQIEPEDRHMEGSEQRGEVKRRSHQQDGFEPAFHQGPIPSSGACATTTSGLGVRACRCSRTLGKTPDTRSTSASPGAGRKRHPVGHHMRMNGSGRRVRLCANKVGAEVCSSTLVPKIRQQDSREIASVHDFNQLEGLAVAIPWGFESPLPHHSTRLFRFASRRLAHGRPANGVLRERRSRESKGIPTSPNPD
jgi:hypothetical protein